MAARAAIAEAVRRAPPNQPSALQGHAHLELARALAAQGRADEARAAARRAADELTDAVGPRHLGTRAAIALARQSSGMASRGHRDVCLHTMPILPLRTPSLLLCHVVPGSAARSCPQRRLTIPAPGLTCRTANSGSTAHATTNQPASERSTMAQNHAASGDIIDILPLGAGLADQVTSAIMKSAQLELVRLVLPSGKAMREHRVAGEITVQCIEGLIQCTTPAESLQLGPGQLIHLQGGEAHSLLALADSSALLTICLDAPA